MALIFRTLFLCLFFSVAFARDPFLLPTPEKNKLAEITLQFTEAKTVAEQLRAKETKLLSAEGSLIVDERTNTVWIEDQAPQLNKILRFIRGIDRPTQQVLIKAKIVMIDKHSERLLGNRLSMHTDLSGHLALLNPANLRWFNAQLDLLEQSGHARVVAAPELITNNRQAASIESGEELPYQEKTGEGNTSIAFKKAVLALKVTPIILPHQKILLKLSLSQNKPSDLIIQGTPSIATQELKTQVIIPHQATYILGGITQYSEQHQQTGLPVLGHLPLLHYLFKQNSDHENDQQLAIFITPEIL